MIHAGEGYRIHYSGLTHDERGYPDMSAETHHRLVSRLTEKVHRNADDIIRVEGYYLEDASLVVIAYGCTARSALSAVRKARADGTSAGLLRLVSLWPFPQKTLRELADKAEKFIVAEMNLGQIRLEVERTIHRPIWGIHHAGGAMIQPQPILDAIRELAK